MWRNQAETNKILIYLVQDREQDKQIKQKSERFLSIGTFPWIYYRNRHNFA